MDLLKMIGQMRSAYEEGYAKGYEEGKKAGKITCKRCKHCEIVEETGRYFCLKPLGVRGFVPVKPEDFCSYAEQKQGAK